MPDPIIKVNNLSKRYRIGAAEKSYKTFREAIMDVVTAPVKNFTKLRNLTKFKEHKTRADEKDIIWALKDVSFEVGEGEVLGIIGRNGAGKTTLLKILSRITEPTAGYIDISGRLSSLLEVGTGFHPELTGRENIFLNGAILGMRKREIRDKFDEIVAFSEIGKFIDTPVKRYSSGMYVRLAFAVAAHLEPEILLVDEVLAVGDIAFQRKCLGKMGEVAKGGKTVLFVSHNMGAIAILCSKAMLLDGGRVVSLGKTSEVINCYLSREQDDFGREEAERAYLDNPEQPAQIRGVRISDHGGAASLKYDILKPIHIDVDFVVRRYFSNLFVACSVFTSLGQVVFSTNEMDWANYKREEEKKAFPKKSGYYRASVVLPAPLLQTGLYELRLTLAEPNIANIETQGGFFIEVMDSGSFMSFPFSREGFLAVPIPWQIEYRNP